MSVSRAALAWLTLLASSCAGRSDMVRWEDVEPVRAPPAPVTPAPAAPAPVVAAAAPAPAPAAPIATSAAILVNGAPVDDGALVEVPALELACIADARALSEPARVAERIRQQGDKLGAQLGGFAFVVLERDPLRSLADPPPRFCRSLSGHAALLAPLLHKREPAARWLVRRAKDGVATDVVALLADCASKGLSPSGKPRVIVDALGAMVAVAVPVGMGGS